MDSATNVNELKDMVKKFCDERDWDKYHNAKDLAIGIVTEASELLEHFRFKSEKQVEEILKDTLKRQEISEEMSDILYFLVRLAERYDIDLSTELKKKIKKNAEKYPVERAHGSNKKYNEM